MKKVVQNRWLLALSITLFAALPVAAQDTVTLNRRARGGSKLLGKITKVSPTEITVSTSGSVRQLAVNQVQRISLSNEPSALRQARTAVMAGQYEQAIEALEGMDDAASLGSIVRQEVGFYRVLARAKLALMGSSDPKKAEAAMKAFAVRERNTFHFFEMAEVLGDLAKASGDYQNAARYYRQMTRAPWPDYKLRSYVLMGGALRAQNKWDDAIQQFEKGLAVSAADPNAVRQQTLARIGRAACWAEKGEADAAVKELQEVIAKNDPEDDPLFSQAYLALGSAYRRADRPLDAVLAYLHVDLLFYGQREAHAEALYHLTKLWPKIDQPSRAVEARQLLQSRYAGSIWAKQSG